MRLNSLRSKIFLLVGLTLLLSALAVLLVTRHELRDTVSASERVAIHNVLNLVISDSDARWGSLLNDKINTVRGARRQLIQLGNVAHAALASYADMAGRGDISIMRAQAMAARWIDNLSIGSGRAALVFDKNLTVLASGDPSLRGKDISTTKDFKGHSLAASAYSEASLSGHSFALFRRDDTLRYAYFTYFAPWDWILAISGDAHGVAEQFDRQRAEMEHSVAQTLSSLRLAQSGFVMIVADDGSFVAPPPAGREKLLDAQETTTGATLRSYIADLPAHGEIRDLRIHGVPASGAGPWEISAAYFKPLRWTILAAVPADDLTRAARSLETRLAAIFAVSLLLSLALAWLLSTRIVRPLRKLSNYARTLPDQDLSVPAAPPQDIMRLPARHHDEVGRLAATVIYMDQQLREKITDLLRETSSRERMESELQIAHDIQMGLLPLPLPDAVVSQLDLHAVMIPAKEVGGDLYDYFPLPDGRLCLAIGDVSDKGVPAALFMAVTRTLIRASFEEETDPGTVMASVNNRLSANNPNMMFVTLLLAVLDLDSGELIWANAGHNPPCILHEDGQVRTLDGRSGPACGVQDDLVYPCFTTALAPGQIFIGFTDGVTEAVHTDDELYGDERLLTLLSTLGDTSTAHDVTQAILADLRAFVRDTEQSDDITLIAAKRSPS